MRMRAGTALIAVALSGTTAGRMAWAQDQATASATTTTDGQERAVEEARQEAITDRYLTTIQGELVGKLDSAKAAVGQEVAVRTTADARLANDTELPKGTILHGRVAQVHAEGQESSGAMMALLFDRAEIKGGKTIPVRCVIQAVNPIRPIPGADRMSMAGRPGMGSMGGGGMADPGVGAVGVPSIGTDAGARGTGVGRVGIQQRTGVAPMGSGVPLGGGPVDASGGVGAGGGMGGGVGAGAGTDATIGGVGGAGAGTTGTIGTTTPTDGIPGAVVGSAPVSPGTYGVAPVRQAGVDLSAVVVPTGFPGLLLSNKRTGGASGVLMESGHNITLDSGTRITMGVISR